MSDIFIYFILSPVSGDDVSTGDPDAILDKFVSKVNRSRSVADRNFGHFILVTYVILDVMNATVQL